MIKGQVVIIGRPNVGKSTLFNCLAKANSSIVSNIPGVTRDYLSQTVYYDNEKINGFTLYDTAGYGGDVFSFESLVWEKTKAIIDKVDLVICLFDALAGVQSFEKELVDYVRKKNKRVLHVVNKIDGQEKGDLSWEFTQIGVVSPLLISAAHRKGIVALKDTIKLMISSLSIKHKRPILDSKACSSTRVAIVGRPNVGKSTLLNKLLSEERALVSDIAGTTRDSIDSQIMFDGKPYVVIDTAGIRRPSKVKEDIELASVGRSIRAIDRADIVVLVVDAITGIVDQDSRLINIAIKRYKPVLIVVNKWDLITNKTTHTQENYRSTLRSKALKDLSFIPIHFISCLKNQRVHNILGLVESLILQRNKIASTSLINNVLQELVAKHPPRLLSNSTKRTKFYYATQMRTTKPLFIIKCNVAKDIQENYKKYMLRVFREKLGFKHIPLQIKFEGKTGS